LNPATKWIIAHLGFVSPYYLLILDPNGNLKGIYSYAGIPNYHNNWRNLLMGYDSTISTFTTLVQTRLASNIGFKLFAFTFSSSNSAPTFLWGFNSFYKTGSDIGFSIIFAST
jgi:hypothetical protein